MYIGPEKSAKENAELGMELVRTIMNNHENYDNVISFIGLAVQADPFWSPKTIYGLISVINYLLAIIKHAEGSSPEEVLDRVSDMISEIE